MLNVKPVNTIRLFPVERNGLLDTLENLNDKQWFLETACEGWCVKDIAQHLLKDDIGILSRKRDGFIVPKSSTKEFESKRELVDYVDAKNQEWVAISRSFSPQIIVDFLRLTGKLTYIYWRSVDLNKTAAIVSWISEKTLPNWTDIAREYTERWLHQSHIREAVGFPLLHERRLFHPFIRTYMLALPLTYKSADASIGDVIRIVVEGEAGGIWSLERQKEDWKLHDKSLNKKAVTEIVIDQDKLWRLFSKGITKKNAKESVQIHGNEVLGDFFFNTVSLIV